MQVIFIIEQQKNCRPIDEYLSLSSYFINNIEYFLGYYSIVKGNDYLKPIMQQNINNIKLITII